jgi:glycosyltransferase involved in cell wall biosynthesis
VRRDARLTILVPARNAEHSLPGWLASAATYADAVIALDDGSTDATRSILEEHPLVTRVLRNPVRPTYHGWDDLTNRQRLVDAARATDAQWLLFLDADERIDADDGKALRQFLENEALPGYAYGFEVFRMVDDDAHYDPRGMWVFRLFATTDGAVALGSQRLHFVPVPGGIPMEHWLQTSLRIQHSGSLTATHRQARFAKYREADPYNEFQEDYNNLLADPASVQPWPARPEGLPVLLGADGRYADQLREIERTAADLTRPAISAVVIAQNDAAVIDRSIGALVDQQLDDEFEIILACSGDDATFARVRAAYPAVRCVQLPEKALPGEARNAGLWMARGDYVSFPGSHVWLVPGSLAARLEAHEEGWDMVTGAVVNGNTTRPGWASYFLDHSMQTPSRPSGEYVGAPGHASYVAHDVRHIGGFPEDMRAGEDTVVNNRLFHGGRRTFFAAPAAFHHASPSTTRRKLFRHHFQRGRALGQIIRGQETRASLRKFRSISGLPVRRMRTITRAMHEADENLYARYQDVRWLVVGGTLAAAIGTWTELLTKRPVVQPAERRDAPRPASASAPILAIAGRPGTAATGLLSAGNAAQAARRLTTFTRYARHVTDVRPALAPIVTSATVTAEFAGTYTMDLARPTVDAYLAAARGVGASLLLYVQPGRASLATLVERWQDMLAEPDVGIVFDVRADVAFADQHAELDDAVMRVRAIGGDGTPILVRGVQSAPPGVVVVDNTLDLQEPGTQYPHDALAARPRPGVLIYL